MFPYTYFLTDGDMEMKQVRVDMERWEKMERVEKIEKFREVFRETIFLMAYNNLSKNTDMTDELIGKLHKEVDILVTGENSVFSVLVK
jgi:hypothetical protein